MTDRPKRNAASTRAAILAAAQVAFTRSGYDGVGVREIAASAGVTAMLVNRYFGSKELLFAEVVEATFARRTLIGDDPATLARDVAAALVTGPADEEESVDGFLLMLRSASNPRAVEILRDAIERHFQRHLADLLPGGEAGERAALILCAVAGVQLMRHVLASPAVTGADPAVLAGYLEAAFRPLVGTSSEPGTRLPRNVQSL
jgi:AcrR family transcriptional regulator